MGIISPTLPTIGQPNATEDVDIVNCLSALLTLVNGSIDNANIAAAAAIAGSKLEVNARPATVLGQYRTVERADAFFNDASPAGINMFGSNASGNVLVANGASVAGSRALVLIESADWSVGGLTTKLRVRAGILLNGSTLGTTFTFGLYPVTVAGAADTVAVTLGTVVSGSTITPSTPSPSTGTQSASGDFNVPSNGIYALGVNLGATPLANAFGIVCARLEVRHV